MNSKRISKEQVSKQISDFLQNNWLIAAVPLVIILSLCSLISLLGNNNLWDQLGIASNQSSRVEQYSQNLETIQATVQTTDGIKHLKLEIARTPQERSTGLMNRSLLASDNGMLFVFENEQMLEFWMKDTYISLDIAFLDGNQKIINIEENAKPLDTSLRYKSESPAKYAIEMNSGWFATNNVQTGDSFNFILE
ncbi:DUF192 domain-containing protein [Candidatus Dojkabacteria bacterium]|nr:DUF192 domain-containing protein [Candidatus Dojkabacteria bacterium]